MKIRIMTLVCALAGAAATISGAMAQSYPVKPVRVIVPQAAGSATDALARLIGQRLSDALGHQVVIENRVGAGGIIGADAAARSAPDGYTLFIGNNSTHGANVVLHSKLPYDAFKDFAPIALVASSPYLLIAHPQVPAATVQELIAYAKANPGKLNFSSTGPGSSTHLAGVLFTSMAGINMVHVPYTGTPAAVAAVIAGDVSMTITPGTGTLPNVVAGKIKALAVTAAKPTKLVPGMATVAESGLPGYDMESWWGLFAPAGTPAAIVDRLNTEVVKILNQPDVQSALAKMGLDTTPGTPERLVEAIRAEIEKTTKIVKISGIKMQ